MVPTLDTHYTTFFWSLTPYLVVVTLLITPIVLFIMPKRKAASTETTTTTIRTKKAKAQTRWVHLAFKIRTQAVSINTTSNRSTSQSTDELNARVFEKKL